MMILKRFHLRLSLLTLCLLLITALSAETEVPYVTVNVPMRDGTVLPTDIYLPSLESRNLPCILIRTPNGRKRHPHLVSLAHQGYAVAIQDTRSVVDVSMPYLSDNSDGHDALEWLAKSEYCNGKIGTSGVSAVGITGLLLAPNAPSPLHCQHIEVAAANLYSDGIFVGGCLQKSQVEGWLGQYSRDPVALQFVTSQNQYNSFWEKLNTVTQAEQISVPALHRGGWYDIFVQGTLDSFASRHEKGGAGARGTQKLIVGPWTHFWPDKTEFGDFPLPEAAKVPPYDISATRWFGHHLKGEQNGIDQIPAVTYFVMGPLDGSASSGNVWRTADTWPIAAQETPLYLTSDKKLVTAAESAAGTQSFKHDPTNPVPTVGGRNLFLSRGPMDQRAIEARDDVIVFSSPELQEDVEVTGRILAKLYVTADVPDSAVAVRLCDVYPDGRSILIADSIARIGGVVGPPALDRPQEITLDLWSTSQVFAKGHRIRLIVSGSNYPRFDINAQAAQSKVHCGEKCPSRILLPIVKRD